MKFAVVTFGCRVNQADSFGIERGLRAAGGSPVPVEAADVVVVNSCSVTATADQGTRQVIRRIARTNAGARIVATGCYASRAAEEVAALPGVVAVVPNADKEALAAHTEDFLVRMSSLEPMDCTPEVVELVTGSPRFAPHFHLPLQHASEGVLQRMRRPYTAAGYRAVVGDIRARLPHAAIGTDLVVGFPGETDADATAPLDFIRESPLTYLHVFPYSDRPCTEATAMAGAARGAP